MNPLHVIGLCEIRDRRGAFPRRKTVWWPNNTLKDDRAANKTIVTHEQQYQAGSPADTRLGVGVPASSTGPTGDGGTQYTYSEAGGQWFGVDPRWSGYEATYIQAEVENPLDQILVWGFAPEPIWPRKFLLNYGPAPIHFGGRDYSESPPGQVRGDLIIIQPSEGLRIFWDHVDNCWRPIQRLPFRLADEGMLAGQIVIQGRPVMVQGRPLVNTVPPLAARAPEPPAPAPKPEVVIATIVERPKRLPPTAAPLARAPRAGEPVELETTFADSSLEMTAEGDKFRVSIALQGVAERVVLDFTLRATSVSSTDYEEIGVQRFDPTGFEQCTLWLVAEMDVAAFGQLAELQLVDLNTGAEVATLSTDKTLTTARSAQLDLPSVATLYSVRLRRSGGNASLRVACRSVALELTPNA